MSMMDESKQKKRKFNKTLNPPSINRGLNPVEVRHRESVHEFSATAIYGQVSWLPPDAYYDCIIVGGTLLPSYH